MRSILLLSIAIVSTMASNVRTQKDDTFETAYAKIKTQTGHSFLGNKDLNTYKTMEKNKHICRLSKLHRLQRPKWVQ